MPALAERNGRWRFWSAVALASTAIGTLGLLLAPLPPLVGPWAWVVLVGIGSGAGFPLGLTVIAWRTPDAATSAATSGMALGVGYTVAGIGPFVMGLLVDLTGGYPAAIAVLIAAAALQAFAIARIGNSTGPHDTRPDEILPRADRDDPRARNGSSDELNQCTLGAGCATSRGGLRT